MKGPLRLPAGERALRPLLVLLLLLVLVAKPAVDLGILPQRAISVAMLLTVLAGLASLSPPDRSFRNLLVAAGLTSAAFQGLALSLPAQPANVGALASAMLWLGLLGGAVLRQSLAPGRVTLRRIEGAVAAYLLIGLVFVQGYDLVATLGPGSFLQNGVPLETRPLGGDFLFFSFVTLTSTGYGDLVPVHPVARSLAMLEAIAGQLYLAVVLARLVSLEVAERDKH